MNKIGVIGILSLLFCIRMDAQDLVRYKFRHLSPKSGLSSIYIRKIIQDPYGFLWIGTQDGLNRYDGKNFVIYNKSVAGKNFITGSDIRDLALDSANHLVWAVNSFGGIDAIDYETGAAVYHYFQTDDKSTATILFISLALQNHLLFIGSTNGCFFLDTREKKLHKIKLSNPFHGDNGDLFIDKVVADRNRNVWLYCKDRGVLLLGEDGTVTRNEIGMDALMDQKKSGIWFYNCITLQDGRILSSTSQGLKIFSIGKDKRISVDNNPFPGIPVSHGRDIYSCGQDRKGGIWFSTPNYLFKIKDRSDTCVRIIEHSSKDEFNWLNAVFAIFFDKEDNIWLGCQQGLAYSQNQPSGFLKICRSSLSDVAIRQAYYIDPVDDSLLYCCAQDGCYKININKGEILPIDTKRPFYHVLTDPSKRLIVSDIDGVFVVRGTKLIALEKIYPEFRHLHKIVVNSHCYVGDSVIVFGTENDRGIVVWNYKKGQAGLIDQHSAGIWVKENTVNTVHKDSKGLIWVLGDTSVSILDFKNHSTQTLNNYNSSLRKFYSIFFDVCEVNDCYYLASYGAGIVVLDRDRHIKRELSVKDGLASNSVYKILPYKDSLIFVTSNNGLSRIDIRHNYKVKNYYESDGLHSDNFEENSGAIRNDLIYAGGTDGLTVIDPSSLPPSYPTKIYLKQIKIETASGVIDTSGLSLTSLKIPNDELQTTVYFSSINYPNPERSSFAYKIKEISKDWIGIGNQDFVYLVGLRPGKYTLQVRSANEEGVWNEHPLELMLIFLPKWYQTLWFKILIAVVISALLYMLYRYRIAQIRKQQQIRKDIASDLHDDIGSILNTVKIFTHLAKKDPRKEDHLTRIEESLAEATTGLRDMIWVLDDSRDTIQELSDRIKKFAIPVTTANGIHFECTVEQGPDDLGVSKTEKRNLLLIAKETINNSIKYAQCGNITVAIQRTNKILSLSIQDDGKGFDTKMQEPGNGLRNIVQRAKQINFHASIISSIGNGTCILISGVITG